MVLTLTPPPDATTELQPKVLILGVGRAGTTFIMEVLIRLGVCERIPGRRLHEHQVTDLVANWNDLPRIVKNPAFTKGLIANFDEYLEAGALGHVIVPMRESDGTAKSYAARTKSEADHNLESEDFHHAANLGRLIALLETRDVPWTPIAFPRLRYDLVYLWDRLHAPLGLPGDRRGEFLLMAAKVASGESIS